MIVYASQLLAMQTFCEPRGLAWSLQPHVRFATTTAACVWSDASLWYAYIGYHYDWNRCTLHRDVIAITRYSLVMHLTAAVQCMVAWCFYRDLKANSLLVPRSADGEPSFERGLQLIKKPWLTRHDGSQSALSSCLSLSSIGELPRCEATGLTW